MYINISKAYNKKKEEKICGFLLKLIRKVFKNTSKRKCHINVAFTYNIYNIPCNIYLYLIIYEIYVIYSFM